MIAFSVFERSPRYIDGMLVNAQLALKYYLGQIMYYYHDNSVPHDKIEELSVMKNVMKNVHLVNMTNRSIQNRRMWRFVAAIDPDIATYHARR